MIKKQFVAMMALMLMPIAVFAQLTVKVQLKAVNADEMRVYVYPFDAESDADASMQKGSDGIYEQTINESALGLYNMVCVTSNAQYALPLYLKKGANNQPVMLMVDTTGDCPRAELVSTSKKKEDKAWAANNNTNIVALGEMNALYYKLSKEVWMKSTSMSADDLKSLVKIYQDKAEEIVGNNAVDANVKTHVNVWAYLLEAEACDVFNRMNSQKVKVFAEGEEVGDAVLKAPYTILDSPLFYIHSSAVHTAVQAVPKGTIDSRLKYVQDNYKQPELRKNIQRSLVNAFIRNYDFTKGYQEGLDFLQNAKGKYDGVDDEAVNAFRERVSATPGAAFPDVALVDAEGNAVSLEKFRGKYVYIDLWASWCVPCVKEVPYLKAMEADLKDSNVVFVSISTDSSEAPWKKKMEQLGMHGNQWWNKDGKLCDKLNVSGIPHFLIYDKEGHMHTYNAPRPSTGSALKKMLEELK